MPDVASEIVCASANVTPLEIATVRVALSPSSIASGSAETVNAAVSSSSTVTEAEDAVLTVYPVPAVSVAVTVLSASTTTSSDVASNTSAVPLPTANTARNGPAPDSISPVSDTVSGTSNVAVVGAVRVSANTAAAPSVTDGAVASIETEDSSGPETVNETACEDKTLPPRCGSSYTLADRTYVPGPRPSPVSVPYKAWGAWLLVRENALAPESSKWTLPGGTPGEKFARKSTLVDWSTVGSTMAPSVSSISSEPSIALTSSKSNKLEWNGVFRS